MKKEKVTLDKKTAIETGEALITFPVVSSPNKDPSLWDGGGSVTGTVGGLQRIAREEATGVGAGPDLGYEVTAHHNIFSRPGADPISSNHEVSFAHMSAFKADKTSTEAFLAASPAKLGEKLQDILEKHTSPLTAVVTGTFEVLWVRTPNHGCSPAPSLRKIVETEKYHFFVHSPEQEEKLRHIRYEDLEKNQGLAESLNFKKDEKTGCFVKKTHLNLVQGVPLDKDKITIRPGDEMFCHKDPLTMTAVGQHTPKRIIYEMGPIEWHMHGAGKLQALGVGGHIYGFSGLCVEKVEVMEVKKTWVRENDGTFREAYGRSTTGVEFENKAKEKLGITEEMIKSDITKAKADVQAKMPYIIAFADSISSKDFQANKKDPWSSFVLGEQQRGKQVESLAERIKNLVEAKKSITSDSLDTRKCTLTKTTPEQRGL